MRNVNTEIKWAVIFTVVALLWVSLEKLSGLHDTHIALHAYLTNLFFFPAVAVYVFALKEKRRKLNGAATYGQLFISGLLMSVFVGLLSLGSSYVTHTIISPDYFANVSKFSVEKGMLTEEAAAQQFNLKSYMMMGAVFSVIAGIITTAVVAAFVKRKQKKEVGAEAMLL